MKRLFPLLLTVALLTVALLAGPLLAAAAVDKGAQTAQSALRKQIQSHAGLSTKAKAFVIKYLLPATTDSVWVKAVMAQNAKQVALSEIQATDKQWIAAEDELPIQHALLHNACAVRLTKLARQHAVISEAFVMDNQGANVCMSALTSDYWQGDEAKWKKSFNGGKGGVDVGKVKFDKSANTNQQQVSLPVIGKGGAVIGAVTFGLAVDHL